LLVRVYYREGRLIVSTYKAKHAAVALAILAGLLVPGLAAANITNTIPFTNSFENYASPPTTIVGVDGWYADDTNVLTVVTNPADMYDSYLGALPLSTNIFTHDKMLILDGSGTNLCINTVDDFYVDMMVQPKRWEEEDPPDVPTNAMRTAFYFNSNGYLVVYATYYKSSALETGWVQAASYQIGTSQWVRLTVDLRLGEMAGQEWFQVFLDNQPMNFTYGSTIRGDPTNTPGPWLQVGSYEHATNTAHKISGIGFSGTGKFDDFQTVITNPLGEVYYNIAITVEPDGGARVVVADVFESTADASTPYATSDLSFPVGVRPYPDRFAYNITGVWYDGVPLTFHPWIGKSWSIDPPASNHTITVTAEPQPQLLTVQTDGSSLPCANNPTNGVYSTQYVYGVQVNLQSTDSNPLSSSTERHSCAWWRTGANTQSGESQGASVVNSSFTIRGDTMHNWLWHTEYSLTAYTRSQHGAYTGTEGNLNIPVSPSKSWHDSGSNVVVVATPSAASPGTWSFSHWSGDTNNSVILSNQITQTMNDANTNLVANFIYTPNGSNWDLTVSSAYGNPTPPVGTISGLADGTVTNCTVEQSIITANTQQYCLGWTGSGSVPSSGSTTNTGLFVLTDDTTVTWNWQTRYKLSTAAINDGTVDPAGETWQNANEYVLLTATPDSGASFVGWTGTNTNDTVVSGNQISIFMDEPRAVVATFTVGGTNTTNGTPYTWLQGHGLTDCEADDILDQDDDGMLTWQEYIAGTDPTNGASYFHVIDLQQTPGSNLVVFYGTTNGATTDFRIYRSTNLTTGAGWQLYSTKPRESDGTNEWWDTAPPAGKVFYRPNAINVW